MKNVVEKHAITSSSAIIITRLSPFPYFFLTFSVKIVGVPPPSPETSTFLLFLWRVYKSTTPDEKDMDVHT